jgi:hypothetical protein
VKQGLVSAKSRRDNPSLSVFARSEVTKQSRFFLVILNEVKDLIGLTQKERFFAKEAQNDRCIACHPEQSEGSYRSYPETKIRAM